MPMFAELMEQNKPQLQSLSSYLVPRLDKMIELLRKFESKAGPDFHEAIQHLILKRLILANIRASWVVRSPSVQLTILK